MLCSGFAVGAESPRSGYAFTTLAGRATISAADGLAYAAGFNGPCGIVVDGEGNVFVADTGNHTIRKITPEGAVSTLAGQPDNPGSADGTGRAALFNRPRALALDTNGNLYVADAGNFTIRKITPAAVVTTVAGGAGLSGSVDGARAVARFAGPGGLGLDRVGNLYVADGNTTVRKITTEGVVTTLAGQPESYGATDGPGAVARFGGLSGLAVDAEGTVYVADASARTLRKITPAGVVSTLAGKAGLNGTDDGLGEAARFSLPEGLAVDRQGNIIVADLGGPTIRVVTPAGLVTTIAGRTDIGVRRDGIGLDARFTGPFGVAVDRAGTIFVADPEDSTIRQIDTGRRVTTLAGRADSAGSADGSAADARFYYPAGVAVDLAGNTYVADGHNHTIRKIARSGLVTTLAGAARQRGSADGPGSAARFNFPSDVAIDGAGNLYVTDQDNFTVRKISPAGEVRTLAGQVGNPGWDDGPGRSARFNRLSGIAVDAAGNVFVADTDGPTVRKITPDGVVSTLAGAAGIFGPHFDGTGTAARFARPSGLAIDARGNLFVTDSNTIVCRITPAGVVTTIAGTPGQRGNTDGTGSAARFTSATDVAVDGLGNVFVTETDQVIRQIAPDGVVTTVAGSPNRSGSADGNGRDARFYYPIAIASDQAGDLYVVDGGNNTIRKGASTTRVANLSIRSRVGTGDQTLIMGFVNGGSAARRVVLRAVGPGLAPMGVPSVVADPQLTLFDARGVVSDQNDNWGGSAPLRDLFASLGAFSLEAASKDAALVATVSAGAHTAHVTTSSAAGGVALVEIYDADGGTDSELMNVSARTTTGTDTGTLIAGFVLTGTAPKTVLIRGMGPSLAGQGVANALADPKIELFDRTGKSLGSNDDWGGTAGLKGAFTQVGAFMPTADGSKDAALLVALPPGVYTAHVTGAGATSGVALLEVYELP